jgi:hypothetical protein
LVLVVPENQPEKQMERWDRGHAFGELLNHGSDAELAPLAFVDVVCARAADHQVAGEPLMLFVDRAQHVRQLDGELPRYGDRRHPDPDEAAISARRIALLARLIAPLRDASDRRSTGELAALARSRWVTQAPPGARWGNASGCGVRYENVLPKDQLMPKCGMGHVPEASRRFLDFYVKAS